MLRSEHDFLVSVNAFPYRSDKRIRWVIVCFALQLEQSTLSGQCDPLISAGARVSNEITGLLHRFA